MPDRDEVRKLIQDLPRLEVKKPVGYGDGATVKFLIGRRPILSDGLQVFIDGAEQTINTDFTADLNTGTITFTSAPANGAEIKATCHFAALSDDEIDSALSRNPGSIYLAASEAIGMILAGRGRLINFSKADGKFDQDAVRKDLKALAEYYRRLGASAAGPEIESINYPASANDDE